MAVSLVGNDHVCRHGWFDNIFGVNDPATCSAREAIAVTEAALGLAGHMIDPFTYELMAKMAVCGLTGDQAVEAILSRFVRTPPPSSGNERSAPM
jgi:hypothetical protein